MTINKKERITNKKKQDNELHNKKRKKVHVKKKGRERKERGEKIKS